MTAVIDASLLSISTPSPGDAVVVGRDRDWTGLAACRSTDPELFFPVATVGPAFDQQVAAAKTVCARCAVRANCLDWALNVGEAYGVWGGTTPEERRSLRRRARRARGPGRGG